MEAGRFKVKGPGNTDGGYGEFATGLIMAVVGGYMVMQNVRVTSGFWSYGGHSALGPLFAVLLLGIFFLFFDAKSWIGWGLTVAAAGAMAVGLVMNMRFFWNSTTGLEAFFMCGLPVAGLGLMLGSLREH